MFYTNVVKRVKPEFPSQGDFFLYLMSHLYEMMDDHETYCDNHFMMYVSQIIMLCTLNLYGAVCQLYLNKTGGKKAVFLFSHFITRGSHFLLSLVVSFGTYFIFFFFNTSLLEYNGFTMLC